MQSGMIMISFVCGFGQGCGMNWKTVYDVLWSATWEFGKRWKVRIPEHKSVASASEEAACEKWLRAFLASPESPPRAPKNLRAWIVVRLLNGAACAKGLAESGAIAPQVELTTLCEVVLIHAWSVDRKFRWWMVVEGAKFSEN